MKKIIALFFVGLLFITTTFAQTIACGINIDNSREFRVIFVNGIDNTIEDACSSSQAIINMVGSTNKFSFSYFYNSKDAKGADQKELSWQSRMSNTALAALEYKQSDIFNNNTKKLDYYSLLGGLYSSAIAENISAPGSVLTTTRRLRDLLSQQLKSSPNRKLLLVAHSQGNFYVEAAYAMLYSEALKKTAVEVNDLVNRIRVVGVASVAASTPNNKYLSHSKDVAVFLGQEAVSRLSQSNYAPLPPDEDACIFSPCNDSSGITEGALYYVAILPSGGNDKALHNFQAVYLNTSIYSLENGKAFPSIISGMMATAILELSQASCGAVTSPAIAGQKGPSYTVTAGQETRFTTTPVPNNGYPFGAYRWKTSEGTEILSTIEQANITFTTAGLGSVTVTPVLADGTVCTVSTATSSVIVTAPLTACASPVKAVSFTENFASPLDLAKWAVSESGGSVRSGGGSVTFSTVGAKSQFPSIATTVDVIPATGNFSLFCRAKYSNTGPYGAGACVATRNLVDAAANANYGGYIGVWGGGGAVYTWGFDVDNRPLYYADIGAGANDTHDYETCVIDGEVTAYVDGKLVARAAIAPESLRPRRIWLGHPGSTASPNTWVTVETSKIEVRELQAGGSAVINYLTTPQLYDNAQSGYVYGQSFAGLNSTVSGVKFYIGDPSRPNDVSVNSIEGQFTLLLYEVAANGSTALLASKIFGNAASITSGVVTASFDTAISTTLGRKYFIGIRSADPFGLGLLAANSSSYVGGSEAWIPSGATVVTEHSTGRDTSFLLLQ